tara:strand:+ start:69 stop:1319 length:1251 start_codon:yes stop_codon:yes gene_type:complete
MPPPNRPKNRPNRPKRNRPRRRPSGSGSGRRGGGSRRAAARREANRRSERNRDRARSGQTKRESRQATGGTSTGRESGIAAANKYVPKKDTKSLEQSVGSLDRRIENALKKGDTNLVKDLRSRQKNFVKKLATKRAHRAMINEAPLNMRDQVSKRLRANPNMMTTTGFDVFQETMDQDFIDPTRKIQNTGGDAYGKMYPFGNFLQKGPVAVQGIKSLFGANNNKQIPYNLPDMPGVRYPLDIGFGAGEGATPITTRSDRQDPLDEKPFTISDRQKPLDPKPVPLPLIDIEFGERPLPDQFPVIDPNTRSEVVDQTMGDIIDSGVQDFSALDKQFQEDQKRIEAENALQQSLADDMQMQKTSQILGGSGYNLNENIINDLFGQGLLEEGTNYFPNPRIGTNPLIDEALQSYYQSLQQ